MSYKDDIPILVNYQGAHDPNFPSFPLGTDYSHNYSDDKGVFFYIYDENSAIAIGLKSFIKDFSISFQFAADELKSPEGNVEKIKSIGVSYKITLDIPAISVNDARVNATRLEALDTMLNKTNSFTDGGETAEPSEETKLILLSNLIHNGKYTKKIEVSRATHLLKYGLPVFLSDLSFKAEVDMGFFEYYGQLFPKVFSLSLDFLAPAKLADRNSSKKLFNSFGKGGTIKDELTRNGTFPFGVNTNG